MTTRKPTKPKAKATPATRKAPRKTTTRKRGGQTKYTAEIADKILIGLAEGKTLRKVCELDKMPSPSSIIRWVIADRDGFAERYAHARELQFQIWADQIIDIADACQSDDVQKSRLRTDNRKWMLSKLQASKYGDRLELGGSIGIRHEDALGELE